MNRLRRPSPAVVVASLALLVALTGTSYAAVTLAQNSVGTVQLRAGAVTSTKVKDGSLRTVDLAPAARRALKGGVGPAGPKGDKGEPGPAGMSGFETVTASSLFNSSPERTLSLSCPTGKKIVGGGGGAWGRAMISVPAGVALTASQPVDDNTWVVAAREVDPTDTEWFLRATISCAGLP